MDETNILFWIVAISTFYSFITLLVRHRFSAQGWILISGTVLVALFFAWLRRDKTLVYVATAMWVLLMLLPGLLANLYQRHLLQQDYSSARRFSQAIALLHPFDGWREQPRIVHALELASQGDVAGAVDILKQFQHVTSPASQTAILNLFRITNRWEEFLEWAQQLPPDAVSNDSFVPVLLRARAEVGDLRGVIELYDRNKSAIARLAPATNRDFCRLVLFGFSGRGDLVRRLFEVSLAALPNQIKAFWLATAELTAGQSATALVELKTQLESADPSTRRAIERRLSKPLPSAATLNRAQLQVIEDAAREHGHEEIFQTNPPLVSRRAVVTQVLIVLNLAMFAREILYGDTTSRAGLIKLGALYPPDVRAGEWWRLFTAMFLHAGIPHIAMNMLCLGSVGPYVESAFGSFRYALIYFFAGVCSMLMVMRFGSGPHGIGITVGASGSIMGLIGAIAAVALLGWVRERAHPAREQFRRVITILLLQTFVDAIIPQISMTAHLSGAFFGFLAALFLSIALNSATRQQGRKT
jgi:rhomboid protease GluP